MLTDKGREFPDRPVVRTPRVQVHFLSGELRFYKLQDLALKKRQRGKLGFSKLHHKILTIT